MKRLKELKKLWDKVLDKEAIIKKYCKAKHKKVVEISSEDETGE